MNKNIEHIKKEIIFLRYMDNSYEGKKTYLDK